jgi:hypothetical protein
MIIGREKELEILKKILHSEKAEFLEEDVLGKHFLYTSFLRIKVFILR